MSPVYPILIAVVVILCTLVLVALFCVGGLLLWQVWALVKINRIISESVAALVDPVKQLPAATANLIKVSTELKEFQEGEVRLMRQHIKAVTDLTGTVEEFEGMLVRPPSAGSPTPRVRRSASVAPATEGDEMEMEQRRKESTTLGGVDVKDFGKNVGTV
jgi:hypothetical protein